MTVLKYVFAVLVIGIIIFIHEFGHFVAAKASGVTVTEFSIGMGPRLFKFTRKGTIYSFRLLLLFGGSCQMLGADEKDDTPGAYCNAPVYKRIVIVLAGPIFNFILALVLSIILFGKMGIDTPLIYDVDKDSPAYAAGLRGGDIITKINGTNIDFYGDYNIFTMEYDGGDIELEYDRNGEMNTAVFKADFIACKYQMGVYLDREKPVFSEIIEGGAAQKAGLLKGDIVKSIDGNAIKVTDEISPLIQKSEGKDVKLVIERDGKEMEITLTPEKTEVNSYYTGMNVLCDRTMVSPIQTVGYSFKNVGYWIKAVFKGFKFLFSGKASVDAFTGPVGLVNMIGDVVEQSESDGWLYVLMNLINWTIMISANLGVMNLLPLPAIDGGKFVFLFIELVRRKPVPKEKEGMVHFIGVIFLLIVTVLVFINDIRKCVG